MTGAIGLQAAAKAFEIASERSYKSVKLKYAGGEPTLNFPLVADIAAFVVRKAQETGIRLESVLLSNGYSISDRIIDTLKALEIKLMISLDGLGVYQDKQRRLAGGGPTFRRVLRNLDLLDQRGLRPHISITVSRQNLPGLPDLLRFILARSYTFHLNFFRENPYVEDPLQMTVPTEMLIVGLREAYQVIEEQIPDFPLTGALLDRVRLDIPHDLPCGACSSYLVVGVDGSVSPCQMLDQSVAALGDSSLLERTFHSGLLENPSVHTRQTCAECQWKIACAGGCPLLTYRSSGTYLAPSPYCPVYRALIPSVLRLEGLRMLRNLTARASG